MDEFIKVLDMLKEKYGDVDSYNFIVVLNNCAIRFCMENGKVNASYEPHVYTIDMDSKFY